jgi:chemotaxis protein MotD
MAGEDDATDGTVDELGGQLENPEPTDQDGSSDPAPKADVGRSLSVATIVGQEMAVAPAVRPQAQPFASERRETPVRSEQLIAGRALSAAGGAKAALADVSDAGSPRPVALAQTAMRQPENASAVRSAAVFEAVTANIEAAAKLAGREVLPEASKVTVIRQETHLPPVPQFTATQQVAHAVVAELKGSPASTPSALPDLAASQTDAPDQPLRILTISLDPPALGNVTVRLRLVGAAVSLQLAADRRDTSLMLEQHRGALRELMQSAGYVTEVAPVHHGALDGFQSGSGQSQSQSSFAGQQQAANGQGASGNSGASSGEPRDGPQQGADEGQPNQETRHDEDAAAPVHRGPVYL